MIAITLQPPCFGGQQ